jgi:alpha-D-ribose 1-methylphosphonate 5-triphosphate synthase subunit PhnI
MVNSGKSGTLEDAIYYSWMCVNEADAAQYMKDGFISHLKLPHYVTFQSKLDRVRKNNRNEFSE